MKPQGILVAARLHDLERPQHRALNRLDTDPQNRVGDELFGARGPPPRRRTSIPTPASPSGSRGATPRPGDGTPREGPGRRAPTCRTRPSTKMRRAPISAASARSGLSACSSPCWKSCRVVNTILSRPARSSSAQIPPEERGVANELVGGDFEQDDHARLVELARTAIHELDPERGLARPRRARHHDDVPARNAAEKNVVEPFDPCLDEVGLRHQVPPALAPGSASLYSAGPGDGRCLRAWMTASRPSRVEALRNSVREPPSAERLPRAST